MVSIAALSQERFWTDKSKYDDAECAYYTRTAKALITPLAKEVAKARQQLLEIKNQYPEVSPVDPSEVKFFEKKVVELQNVISNFENRFNAIESRFSAIESKLSVIEKAFKQKESSADIGKASESKLAAAVPASESEDVDLFGSDSEEESEEAAKVREERLAAYNAKKSKKPQLIAKSNIILDIKPWDDETNLKEMEAAVRKIETDGLVWGAAKLVPLAYGIHKLQISCVVEDEKVSVDWLQEEIEKLEEYIQSVDIAAFNKV